MADILLTFHSSTLRSSDIMLLNPGYWLNDQIILFYFEYLSQTAPASDLFLDPGTSFLLLFEDDINDLKEAMINISLVSRDFIFAAINDNDNPSSSGGCH